MTGPRTRVRSWPQAQMPAAVREQASALQEDAWPGNDPGRPGIAHDPALSPLSTMAAFFSHRACAHARFFRHSRIALYPGTIDRLW